MNRKRAKPPRQPEKSGRFKPMGLPRIMCTLEQCKEKFPHLFKCEQDPKPTKKEVPLPPPPILSEKERNRNEVIELVNQEYAMKSRKSNSIEIRNPRPSANVQDAPASNNQDPAEINNSLEGSSIHQEEITSADAEKNSRRMDSNENKLQPTSSTDQKVFDSHSETKQPVAPQELLRCNAQHVAKVNDKPVSVAPVIQQTERASEYNANKRSFNAETNRQDVNGNTVDRQSRNNADSVEGGHKSSRAHHTLSIAATEGAKKDKYNDERRRSGNMNRTHSSTRDERKHDKYKRREHSPEVDKANAYVSGHKKHRIIDDNDCIEDCVKMSSFNAATGNKDYKTKKTRESYERSSSIRPNGNDKRIASDKSRRDVSEQSNIEDNSLMARREKWKKRERDRRRKEADRERNRSFNFGESEHDRMTESKPKSIESRKEQQGMNKEYDKKNEVGSMRNYFFQDFTTGKGLASFLPGNVPKDTISQHDEVTSAVALSVLLLGKVQNPEPIAPDVEAHQGIKASAEKQETKSEPKNLKPKDEKVVSSLNQLVAKDTETDFISTVKKEEIIAKTEELKMSGKAVTSIPEELVSAGEPIQTTDDTTEIELTKLKDYDSKPVEAVPVKEAQPISESSENLIVPEIETDLEPQIESKKHDEEKSETDKLVSPTTPKQNLMETLSHTGLQTENNKLSIATKIKEQQDKDSKPVEVVPINEAQSIFRSSHDSIVPKMETDLERQIESKEHKEEKSETAKLASSTTPKQNRIEILPHTGLQIENNKLSTTTQIKEQQENSAWKIEEPANVSMSINQSTSAAFLMAYAITEHDAYMTMTQQASKRPSTSTSDLVPTVKKPCLLEDNKIVKAVIGDQEIKNKNTASIFEENGPQDFLHKDSSKAVKQGIKPKPGIPDPAVISLSAQTSKPEPMCEMMQFVAPQTSAYAPSKESSVFYNPLFLTNRHEEAQRQWKLPAAPSIDLSFLPKFYESYYMKNQWKTDSATGSMGFPIFTTNISTGHELSKCLIPSELLQHLNA